MKQLGADAHWISTLDDIAWLTNLRGGDVSYNPVFISHLLLDAKNAKLFVAEGKVQCKACVRAWPQTGLRSRPTRTRLRR